MRRAIIVFLIVSGFAASGQTDNPCPLSSAVTVDGNADEWPMVWVEDGEKTFSYNVCADEQNLFVRLRINEFFAKRKTGAFGLTLWIDPSGKKKKKYGLKFPAGGAEAEERMGQINAEGKPGSSSGEQADYQKKADRMMIANLEILELIGLADDPITATRSGITNGIKVAIDVDPAGSYVYEAIIPFKSYRLSRANISELSVGFETGKMVPPKQKSTAKNPATAQGDLTPSQLSRMQGYQGMQGNPKLLYSSDVWTKLVLKK